jgi:type IV pilus assembly protein PilF
MLPLPVRCFWRRLYSVIGLAITTMLLTSCASSEKARDEAELRLRIGTSYLQSGNYPYALRELQTAEKLDPKNEMIQNNLGLVYFFRDRYELSASHLKRAIDMKPEFAEARNNYARVLIELTRYDQAIAELKRVVEDLTYPDPAKAWVNMGLAYFRKGDFATARSRFAQAIQLNRDNCLAQNLYGRTLLELGKLQDATQALDNAIVICRRLKYDEPNYFSGLAYYKLGKASSAIARMEEVVKLYPDGAYAKKAESMLKLMK